MNIYLKYLFCILSVTFCSENINFCSFKSSSGITLPQEVHESFDASFFESKGYVLDLNYSSYEIIGYLGDGGFAFVLEGFDIETREKVALKFEPVDHETEERTLINEMKSYKRLKDSIYFPKIYNFGTVRPYNVMVMQLLSPSLRKLYNEKFLQFQSPCSLDRVLSIGRQLLSAIRDMHSHNIIHNDIHLDNICYDLNDPEKVYLIDFGYDSDWELSVLNNRPDVRYLKFDLLLMLGCLVYLYTGIPTDYTFPNQGIIRYDSYRLVHIEEEFVDISLNLCPLLFREIYAHLKKCETPDYDFIEILLLN